MKNGAAVDLGRLWTGVAVLGVSIAFVAVLGRWIGLGQAEDFLFFRLFGLTRGAMLKVGLVTAAIGVAMNLRPAGAWSAIGRAFVRRLPVGLFDLAAWHRDWVAGGVVLLGGIYVVLFAVMVLPHVAFVAPDSRTYIVFNIIRPLLYPMMIRMAALTNDIHNLIVAQLIIAAVSTALFSEALQRLVKNYIVSILTGLFLQFNWLIFVHGLEILSDQPFYSMICLHLAIVFFSIERPTRLRMVLLAVTIAMAIWLRPVGAALVLVVPFLGIVVPGLWRRVLAWCAAPLVALVLLQAAANLLVFDFFGLTIFGGYQIMGNTLYLLKADTPFEYPDLVARLYAIAAPRQEALAALGSWRDQNRTLVNDTNLILGMGGKIVTDYVAEKGLHPTLTDPSRQIALVRTLNGMSVVNKKLGRVGLGTSPSQEWYNALETRLWWAALGHNPLGFIHLTAVKFPSAWADAYGAFGSPNNLSEYFADYTALRLDDPPHFGFDTRIGLQSMPESRVFNVRVFRWMNAAATVTVDVLWGRITSLLAALLASALVLRARLRHRVAPPPLVALACAGMVAVGYTGAVCVGQVAITRFTMVILPALMPLVLSPALLLLFLKPLLLRWRDAASLASAAPSPSG